MKTRKRCLLSLLASLLLCACGSDALSSEGSEGVSSENSGSSSAVESFVAESFEPSSEESTDNENSAVEEPTAQSPAFYALNSMSYPVILLPFHTVENYPHDYVSAMCKNPIDRIWIHDLDEINQKEVNPTSDYVEATLRNEQLWKKEIERTIEQLCSAWSGADKEELKQYAENALQVALNQTTLSGLEWGWRGTIFPLIHAADDVNAHRQVAFQLKYWLYLIETADGGQASASLQFADESSYTPETFSAVLCGQVSLIEVVHAPAYVGENWEEWVAAMESHPLNQVAADRAIPQWQEEIQANLQRVGQYMSDLTWVEQHGEAFLQHCEEEREWEMRLLQAGFLADDDNTRATIAWQEMNAYRQLAFTYNYWALLLEELCE